MVETKYFLFNTGLTFPKWSSYMGLICFPGTGAYVFNFLREYSGINSSYLQNYITLETLLFSIQISY